MINIMWLIKKNALFMLILLSISFISAISELKVGYYDNPPKIYKDDLSGQAEGFWADITKEIGKDGNINIIWVFGSWNEGLERLNSGNIDVMVDVAETEARKEKMLFNQETIMLSWSTIYTNKNTKIKSFLDFKDQTIGVLMESVNYNSKGGAIDLFNGFNIDVKFIEFDSYIEVFDAISKGLIFAGVACKDIGNIYLNNGLVNSAPLWFQPNSYKYAISLNNPNAQEINSILDKYIAKYKKDDNSIYYRALKKHFYQQSINSFPDWAKLSLAILSIIIIVFYLFNRILSAKVKEQTKNLLEEIHKKESVQKSLLINKNKLEGMNQIKDNFLRSVSHELMTPLNAILGFSEILLKTDGEIDASLRKEYLKLIHKSGTKLLKIVNDMIDATLINSNLISLISDEINIYDSILDIFTNYQKSDNLTYKLEIPGEYDISLTMVTDFDKLKKILVHLLDNATKFTEQGEIVLGYKLEPESLILFVKDSGIGIQEKDKELIFQGFTQGENKKDRVSEGSGLGLSIVSALVTSLKGRIWVKSSLDKGSTFCVKLPRKMAKESISE